MHGRDPAHAHRPRERASGEQARDGRQAKAREHQGDDDGQDGDDGELVEERDVAHYSSASA